MIFRIIYREKAQGTIHFKDINKSNIQENDFKSKDKGDGVENQIMNQFQAEYKYTDIMHVWSLGDENSFDNKDDAKNILAEILNLKRDYDFGEYGITECALDAMTSFLEKGYTEAEALFNMLKDKGNSIGKPIVCQWCAKLHHRTTCVKNLENYLNETKKA